MIKRNGWKWFGIMSLMMLLILAGCQSKDNDGSDNEEGKGQETPSTEDGDREDQGDGQEGNEEYDPLQEIAMNYVTDIVMGNYEEAYTDYSLSDAMKEAVSAEQYEEFATTVVNQYGAFEKITDSQRAEQNGFIVWHIFVQYEKGAIAWHIAFDEDEHIAGLNMSPYDGEVDEEDVDDEALGEEVTVGTEEYPLEGTYIRPQEGYPVVILVQGSGPSDRNETVGPNKPFKSIAKALESNGIGSLRYDKRTYVYGQEMVLDSTIGFYEETVEDVKEAINYLHDKEGIDYSSIVVLGHSMGGYLVPMIDQQIEDIGGYILLAGNHRSLVELIPKQLLYLAKLDGDITPEKQAEIDAVSEAFASLDEAADDAMIMGAYASYWKKDIAYDPDESAEEITEPVLVLQGEADYQVTMEDFVLWQQVWGDKKNATFKSYPGLNHFMIPVEGRSRPEEMQVKKSMSEEVLEDISQWVLGL